MINYPMASSTWDEKELKAIQELIKSGHFTIGEKVAEFKKAFVNFVGLKYALMVSSGSAANLIATNYDLNDLKKAIGEVANPYNPYTLNNP